VKARLLLPETLSHGIRFWLSQKHQKDAAQALSKGGHGC
jgi:hypothetical protein